MWTLPNLLSLLRLVSVPGLLFLAAQGFQRAFLMLLLLGLLSDAVDGYLARRWNQHSELGARLDSWADLTTWLALTLCGRWLRPEAFAAECPWLCTGLAAYLLSVAVGWARFRRLIAYHTWGAKALSVLASAAVILFFAHGPGWVLRALVPFVVLSAAEEILITCLLPQYRSNVPTAWHAWQLRRASLRKEPPPLCTPTPAPESEPR